MKVSVIMVTYNHGDYIKEAIEGVLMQEVDFAIELILSNDNSPDNTDKIVKEILNTHPRSNRIKYFSHSNNKGPNKNFEFSLQQCSGEYIAICEGDDYWTDPNKLQKQVDFLDQNEEYMICAHNIYEKRKSVVKPRFKKLKDGNLKTLIMCGLNQGTLSVVFRNKIRTLPEWFFEVPNSDYAFYFLLLKDGGKIKYLEDLMAVYRIHGGGVWSSLPLKEMGEKGIRTRQMLDRISDYKYTKWFKRAIVNRKKKFGLYRYSIKEVINGDLPIVDFLNHYYDKTKDKMKSVFTDRIQFGF